MQMPLGCPRLHAVAMATTASTISLAAATIPSGTLAAATLSMFGCQEALAPRVDPTLVGDDKVMPRELRPRQSASDFDDATRAWAILVEGVFFVPLADNIFMAGSLIGGWKVVEDWFEPTGAALKDVRGSLTWRTSACKKWEIPVGMDRSR